MKATALIPLASGALELYRGSLYLRQPGGWTPVWVTGARVLRDQRGTPYPALEVYYYPLEVGVFPGHITIF
jgi:hypothetical protein